MSASPGPLDVTFTAPIGVAAKGDLWSCVEIPGSLELFGTARAVKVVATVDGEPVTAGCCPPVSRDTCCRSARSCGRSSKDLNDPVTVHLTERLA